MSRFNSRCGKFISVCNQPPRPTQCGHPFVGRCNEYQPKGCDTLRLQGVKADMVRVWVTGKTVWFPCYTPAISERFRGVAYYTTECYTNSRYLSTVFHLHFQVSKWSLFEKASNHQTDRAVQEQFVGNIIRPHGHHAAHEPQFGQPCHDCTDFTQLAT